MEHIVVSNVAQHLKKHNILYGLWHVFCKKRSCGTQLLKPVEELCRKVSNCHQVDFALLDFSKALIDQEQKTNQLKNEPMKILFGLNSNIRGALTLTKHRSK